MIYRHTWIYINILYYMLIQPAWNWKIRPPNSISFHHSTTWSLNKCSPLLMAGAVAARAEAATCWKSKASGCFTKQLGSSWWKERKQHGSTLFFMNSKNWSWSCFMYFLWEKETGIYISYHSWHLNCQHKWHCMFMGNMQMMWTMKDDMNSSNGFPWFPVF